DTFPLDQRWGGFEDPAYGGDVSRWGCAAAQLGAGSVGEHTVDRANPAPNGSEAERSRTGGVRGDHSADSAEGAAGRIDDESKAMSPCRVIDLFPHHAGLGEHASPLLVDRVQLSKATEI